MTEVSGIFIADSIDRPCNGFFHAIEIVVLLLLLLLLVEGQVGSNVEFALNVAW